METQSSKLWVCSIFPQTATLQVNPSVFVTVPLQWQPVLKGEFYLFEPNSLLLNANNCKPLAVANSMSECFLTLCRKDFSILGQWL